MPKITDKGVQRKKVQRRSKAKQPEKPELSSQKVLEKLVTITVEVDGAVISRDLKAELEIPWDTDDLSELNDVIARHPYQQYLYGTLLNHARKNYKRLKREYERWWASKRKIAKDSLEGKPTLDDVAIKAQLDNQSEYDNWQDALLEAEELQDNLEMAFKAFVAQKDDLVTLSSNLRQQREIFQGLKERR